MRCLATGLEAQGMLHLTFVRTTSEIALEQSTLASGSAPDPVGCVLDVCGWATYQLELYSRTSIERALNLSCETTVNVMPSPFLPRMYNTVL